MAQLQGLANLSLLLSDPDIRPDMMIWLGQVWGDGLAAHNEALRTANRIFVKGVNENYPITQAKNRGVGVGFIANERTLIEDCHFYGWMAAASSLMTNQYNNIKDNNFEYVFGAVQTIAKYSFLERNTITGHPELYVESHGIFTRSNTYAADNDIRNMGNDIAGNEGEGICSDSPEMRFDAGLVLKADATSITAAPNVNYPDPLIVHNGTLKVTITDGRGMGQTRAVANIDRAAHVITFDRPFDVIPDSTSKFALYTPTENLTVYRNTTHNVLNGVVIWWGGYDDVIANNNLTDSYGIYVAAALSSNFSCPSYFTRVTGNTVVGVDRLNKYSGIGVVTQRSNNGSYFGVQAYATEIRNNILIGDNTATDHRAVGMQYPPVNGIYLAAYGYGGANGNNNGTGTGDITNSIIEGNQLSNLTTGVTLTKCDSGQVVANNRYDSSVLTFLNDRSSDNTLVTGNVSGDLAPAFAQAGNQTATVGRAFSFTLHAADPENDALTYSASNLPHGAALDGATGAFSWTPARSQAGTYVVHFTVSDGTLSDGEDVTITVVDKTRLEVEIQQAGRLDGGKYTAESWTALQTALTQAGTVDSDPAATQAEADGAFHALAKAIAGLRVKAVVTGVTVSPSHPSVRTGATVDFRAAVHGTGSPSQKVTWAVSGNKSSGTSIDSAGRLTVAADETAVTLTVTATSSVDGSKSGTAAVKVKQASHSASGGRGFSLWHFLSLISFRHIWSFH